MRRQLVVGSDGRLAGVVSLDDLLLACARDVARLVEAMQTGLRKEADASTRAAEAPHARAGDRHRGLWATLRVMPARRHPYAGGRRRPALRRLNRRGAAPAQDAGGGESRMERDDRVVGGATWRGVLLQAPLAQGCVIMGAAEVLAGDDGPADGALPRALRGYRLTTLSVGPRDDDDAPAHPEGDEIARWTTALGDALRWLDEGTSTALPVGLLGAGASAAAAMRLAVGRADRVRAVVCCSGCVEVAHAAAARVRAPTLMLVGATDADALAASRQALARLRVQARLEVIPGATRDFAEPGTLDTLAHMAGSWLRDHLAAPLRN